MKHHYLYITIIILLVLFALLGRCHLKKKAKEDVRIATQSAASLMQDTLIKVIKKKDTYWELKVSELSPKEVNNSDLVNELRYDQQLLLIELARYKNLVASQQTKFTGGKKDTVTQYIRIPVYSAFTLAWMDTIGGFTYTDTVYVDSNMTKRKFTPQLQFTHDVRILKNRKNEITGEIRVLGLEEFDLVGQNVYSFYSKASPADIRRGRWKKAGNVLLHIGENSLSFYLGRQSAK